MFVNAALKLRLESVAKILWCCGASWAVFGGTLERLGGVFRGSWGVLEASWERLGLSWTLLGSLADFQTI